MLKLFRHSVMAKILGLLLLTVVLCIPLDSIDALNRARGDSQREAAAELARTYTGAQTVTGPLLVVPYVERWTETRRSADGRATGSVSRSRQGSHIVFPDKLHIEGSLAPRSRYRGVFEIAFYELDAALTGGFPPFDPALVARSEAGSKIEFRTPFMAFGASDLRGLVGTPVLTAGGAALRFSQRAPGPAGDSPIANDIHAPLEGAALAAWLAGQALPFDLWLGLIGQETLSMVPLAGETTAHLTSPWAHPSFGGHFLAAERTVTAQGFDARWRISSLVTSAREQVGAGASQAVAGDAAATATTPPQTFDVSLVQPLNVYSMSTRAGKYGVLFIALVLMAAFMAELFGSGPRLHPVQYALVGLSIAVFFLLLLALSEKLPFRLAYAGAAGASVLLLAAYFGAVLGGWRRGAGFGAYVAVLYAALYGLLASEDNALLLGALLIFGMLAAMMIATRKVDWYALGAASAAPAKPVPGPAGGASEPCAAAA